MKNATNVPTRTLYSKDITMKTQITFRLSQEAKELLKRQAKESKRSLNNYLLSKLT